MGFGHAARCHAPEDLPRLLDAQRVEGGLALVSRRLTERLEQWQQGRPMGLPRGLQPRAGLDGKGPRLDTSKGALLSGMALLELPQQRTKRGPVGLRHSPFDGEAGQ